MSVASVAPAQRWRRALAGSVDAVVVLAALGGLVLVAARRSSDGQDADMSPSPGADVSVRRIQRASAVAASAGEILQAPAVRAGGFVFEVLSTRGDSPGGWLAGVVAVDKASGERVGLARVAAGVAMGHAARELSRVLLAPIRRRQVTPRAALGERGSSGRLVLAQLAIPWALGWLARRARRALLGSSVLVERR